MRARAYRCATALLLLIPLLGAPVLAAAKPLAQDAHITESLVAARAGDVIRKTCPTISARMFVVWRKSEDLKSYARGLGHSDAEITAFLKDKAEKKRIYQLADAFLKKAGAKANDAQSYCRVGEAEIARKTLLGSLLRSSR